MSGKSFELHELFAHDDDDEYHTPMESRRGSVYTLDISLEGSGNSDRGSPDLGQAEGDQTDVPQPDEGVDFAHPNSSMARNEQSMSSAARSVPGDHSQTIAPSIVIQRNSMTVASSSSLGDLFSNHEKLVLDLRAANATLTERVGQLETSHSSWQDLQTRLIALESMSTPQ